MTLASDVLAMAKLISNIIEEGNFNKRSGKTCFHLAVKCKGPYIVGTRDTEELKTCNMRKFLNKIHSSIGEDAVNKDNKYLESICNTVFRDILICDKELGEWIRRGCRKQTWK